MNTSSKPRPHAANAANACGRTLRTSSRPASAPDALSCTIPPSGSRIVGNLAANWDHVERRAGSAEKSLVEHYYQSVLQRVAEPGGIAFWTGEAQRLQDAGANVSETWRAMAMSFFFGAEYALLHRDDRAFLADLYSTFFARLPDEEGMSFWRGQMEAGMPREAVLVAFMFSPEFAKLMRANFGAPEARPEVDMIMDFYRGLLARLPDSAGLAFYLRQLRQARGQGAGAVYALVESITGGFIISREYADRGRTNAQLVTDLYNAFLRRGPDLEGLRFYVDQMDTGAKSREEVRRDFAASAEFDARVRAVIDAGGEP